MATSSFSRDFIVSDPKAIETLIHSFENPTKIKLEPQKEETEEERKAFLCKLKEHIRSQNY